MAPTANEPKKNTLIVSDLHISAAEPPHPNNPLWKRFKRPKYFVDKQLQSWLRHMLKNLNGPAELVLNGDILDFDSVMAMPKNPSFSINWLERSRGLSSELPKSRFKLEVILNDHPVFVEALREFVQAGNDLIFVLGNHDMEMFWPELQADFINKLQLNEEDRGRVRFCDWFYISEQDSLIEHSHQYDAYCMCNDPISPMIKKGRKTYVRLPFGNLAGKFMLNGMGLMNPHVEASYIKENSSDYLVFFYRYIVRVQPFIIWTWFWSALVTMFYSVREGLMPALKDPLTLESRVQDIAQRSKSSPAVVRSLRALHVHPAIFSPTMILRELWLDRALLFMAAIGAAFYIFSITHLFVAISYWWLAALIAIAMPPFILYASTVESDIYKVQKIAFESVPTISQIAGVKRVIFGHTHRERHTWQKDIEIMNTGTWSPAFLDPECTQFGGRKCFVWIKPEGPIRIAKLFEWNQGQAVEIQSTPGK